MRPISKGDQPYTSISKYQEAQPYLIRQIGDYCSFCEMSIAHVPEVEHKESKNSGGALTDWGNLLLSCKYCNSRKGEKIKFGQHDEAIWPDEHNTFLAYTYRGGLPKLNEAFLLEQGDELFTKAKRLFDAVKLNNLTSGKDRRFIKRSEALKQAELANQSWQKLKCTSCKNECLQLIVAQAKTIGFFSVWMMVFENEEDVKLQLVDAFPGTNKKFFNCMKE